MRILIIGAGDVGFQLGRRLSRDQHDITIVDEDPAKVRRAAEQLDGLAIEGSGDSYQVLLQAGLRDADVVAAVTDNDNANLMACRLAKAYGVDVTIARAQRRFHPTRLPAHADGIGRRSYHPPRTRGGHGDLAVVARILRHPRDRLGKRPDRSDRADSGSGLAAGGAATGRVGRTLPSSARADRRD